MDPTPIPDTYEAALGRDLKKAMDRRGLSARQLAALIDFDHSDLSRILRGRATSMERYDTIARALGMVLVVRFRPEARRAA